MKIKEADTTNLEVGKQIELEHKPTLEKIKAYYELNQEWPTEQMVAEWIAQNHLDEFPNYYEKLVPMEIGLKNDKEIFAIDSSDLLQKNESVNKLKEADFTKLSDAQIIQYIKDSVAMDKNKLNRNRDLVDKQMELASKNNDDKAYKNLEVMAEIYRAAFDIKEFGDTKPQDYLDNVKDIMNESIIPITEDIEIKHLGIILEKGERIQLIKEDDYGLKEPPDIYISLDNALSARKSYIKPVVIMVTPKGDRYWIVLPVDAEKLYKKGFKYIMNESKIKEESDTDITDKLIQMAKEIQHKYMYVPRGGENYKKLFASELKTRLQKEFPNQKFSKAVYRDIDGLEDYIFVLLNKELEKMGLFESKIKEESDGNSLFSKYKNPDEAKAAQKKITAQGIYAWFEPNDNLSLWMSNDDQKDFLAGKWSIKEGLEGSGEMPKEIENKIIDYVKTNSNLDDDQFHDFVKSLGIEPHEAEEVIYRTLNKQNESKKIKEDIKTDVINYYKLLVSNSPNASDDVLDRKIADYFRIPLKQVKDYLG